MAEDLYQQYLERRDGPPEFELASDEDERTVRFLIRDTEEDIELTHVEDAHELGTTIRALMSHSTPLPVRTRSGSESTSPWASTT